MNRIVKTIRTTDPMQWVHNMVACYGRDQTFEILRKGLDHHIIVDQEMVREAAEFIARHSEDIIWS